MKYYGSLLLVFVFCTRILGAPDILWQNRAKTTCSLWSMTGTTFNNSTTIHWNGSSQAVSYVDPNWKAVGYGNFGGAANKDILWRHQTVEAGIYVWYLTGTDNTTYVGSGPIVDGAGNPVMTGFDWKVMAVGDFNGDGQTDIALQNDVVGQKAVWLMNGPVLTSGAVIAYGHPAEWQIRGAGRFDGDTKDDLVLQNTSTLQLAIWYMNGASIAYGLAVNAAPADLDWRVVNAADFAGSTGADIMFRYVTNGRNIVWRMNNNAYAVTDYLKPETDLSQAVATQDWKESTWRQDDPFHPRISVSVNNSIATLKFRFTGNLPSSSRNVKIRRRDITIDHNAPWPIGVIPVSNPSGAAWETLPFPDSGNPLTNGRIYEYEVQWDPYPQQNLRITTGANTESTPFFTSRGKVLLLVDQSLVALNHAGFNAALNTFVQDLAGDGWTVEGMLNAPRHDDRVTSASPTTSCAGCVTEPDPIQYSCGSGPDLDQVTLAAADAINAANEATLKTWINQRAPTSKGVIVIGHVTQPFSGNFNANLNPGLLTDPLFVDGHCNHRGSFVADNYYGDTATATEWGNTVVSGTTCRMHIVDLTSCTPPWNRNTAGDYRHDKNSVGGIQELFVGRIDFARLPTFGTGDAASTAEANLVASYLAKNHDYRRGVKKVEPRAICYTTFQPDFPDEYKNAPLSSGLSGTYFENGIRNSSSLYGTSVGKLRIGWPLHQHSESYAFGFSAGNSGPEVVSVSKVSDAEGPIFIKWTSDFAYPALEPQIGFHVLLGSYFGDYYFKNDVMRALLTTANFNYAALYSRDTKWQFSEMALGECLGQSVLTRMNEPYLANIRDTLVPDVNAFSAVVGDPTLHINVVPAPAISREAGTTAGTVKINIIGEGSKYYVYRYQGVLPTVNDPTPTFQPVEGPISGPFSESIIAPGTQYVYMVKAVKAMPAGGASYYILSQGTYLQVSYP